MLRVHAALWLAQLLFGLWPVAGSAVLREISPPALIGYRLLLGAPLLCLVAGLPWRKPPGRGDLVKLAGLAASGIAINQLLYAEGLKRAGPVNAGVLIVMIPALTVGLAALLRVERPRPQRIAGVVIALAGAALLARVERFDLSDDTLYGSVLLLGNTTAYAVYLVLGRPVITRVGALPAIAWVFLFGAIETLPWTLSPLASTDWGGLSSGTYGALAFILVGPTLLTYALNAYALTRVEASLVAVYIYVQPVVSALASYLVLDVVPQLRTVLSALVIFAGVALSSGLLARQRPRPA